MGLLVLGMLRNRGVKAIVLSGLLLLAPIMGFANLSFFRLSYVADHWTYPALMVFSVALAYAVARLPRRMRLPLSAALLLILCSLTWQRAGKYHDTLSLWEDAARKNQTSYAIFTNLAWAYLDAHRVSEARVAAERAAELEPQDENVRQTLAAVELRAAAGAVAVEKETPR